MRFLSVGRTVFYTLAISTVVTAILALIAIQYLTYFLPDSLPALTRKSQELTTDTWGVFDPETGAVIAGNNIDTSLPIASVAKLFTAVAVLESTKQEETSTIVFSDVAADGRAGKLWYGDQMTPYDLLFPLLLESSNDAAEAIRRILGGEYDAAVHRTIETLSLAHTTITEPSGLSRYNVSSVTDISAFYADLKRTYPHIIDITQLRVYVGPKNGYINNNPARAFESFTGGKHGFTDEAGRTFVGTFRSPDTGSEFGLVLLKSSDLRKDIETLLAYEESLEAGSGILAP
jgi:serine-type D-Ala-D-Ala carboxypeptidase (penicillin-binding protein 5/6)